MSDIDDLLGIERSVTKDLQVMQDIVDELPAPVAKPTLNITLPSKPKFELKLPSSPRPKRPKVDRVKLDAELTHRRYNIDQAYIEKTTAQRAAYIRPPCRFDELHFAVDVSDYTQLEIELATTLNDLCWSKQTDWLSEQAVEQTMALRQAKWLVAHFGWKDGR